MCVVINLIVLLSYTQQKKNLKSDALSALEFFTLWTMHYPGFNFDNQITLVSHVKRPH